MSEVQILFPEKNDIIDLVNLNTNYFAKAEQTNKSLNIPQEMYSNYAEYIITKALPLEQILIAKKNNNIIGYLIWEDYCKPLVEGIKGNPDVYRFIAPEIAFVEQLEKELNNKYQFKEKDCVKLMQVGVLPEFQKQRIATLLTGKVMVDIIARGYKYAIADCTADNSWQVLFKFGFKILTEISFSDFNYNGLNPFGELNGKRRLVIKHL